jgi:hypothetical protein
MKAVYVITLGFGMVDCSGWSVVGYSLDEKNNNRTVAQVEVDSSSLINEYNAMYDSLWYSWE